MPAIYGPIGSAAMLAAAMLSAGPPRSLAY
jgi:hypothetical protein